MSASTDEQARLRIAFVTPYGPEYHAISTHTGRRIDAWRELGARVDVHIIGDGRRRSRSALGNLRKDFVSRTVTELSVAESRPDVIYARWLTPIPGLYRKLSQIAPLVLEIHADDVTEIAADSRMRHAFMKVFRGRELRCASGATFVVAELGKSENFDLISERREVFTNGSWLSRREIRTPDRPKVGVSVGAVFPSAGIDRFGQLASELRDIADWVIACPEGVANAVAEEAGRDVTVVPTRNEAEYIGELSTWSVAMGSMGIERKGLRTASTLKVCDYVGLGVPTVLPYWDEGVAELDDPRLLKLAGPESAPVEFIDRAVIRDFIIRAHGRDLDPRTSRSASSSMIEARRLAFLQSFARSL